MIESGPNTWLNIMPALPAATPAKTHLGRDSARARSQQTSVSAPKNNSSPYGRASVAYPKTGLYQNKATAQEAHSPPMRRARNKRTPMLAKKYETTEGRRVEISDVPKIACEILTRT